MQERRKRTARSVLQLPYRSVIERTSDRRLVVDGMNLIGSRPNEWWRDRRRAMRELVEELEQYAGESGEPVTVVFDARPGAVPATAAAVRVLAAAARDRDAADEEIVRIVDETREPGALTVVTSDARLAARVRALGADVVSSGTFRSRLDRLAAG
jgi:predicted RNA-binding protein with PIN domain